MPRKMYGLDEGLISKKGKLEQGVNIFLALELDPRGTESSSPTSFVNANSTFSDEEAPSEVKAVKSAKRKMAKQKPLSHTEYEQEQKRKAAEMAMMVRPQ